MTIASSSSSSSSITAMNKSVQFNSHVVFHDPECAVEKALIWYSREDYRAIRAYEKEILQKVFQGKFIENNTDSIRGLENRLREATQGKSKAMVAVFREQSEQNAVGYSNPELLSQKYQAHTQEAATLAQAVGRLDAKMAVDIHAQKTESRDLLGRRRGGKKGQRRSSMDNLKSLFTGNSSSNGSRRRNSGDCDQTVGSDRSSVAGSVASNDTLERRLRGNGPPRKSKKPQGAVRRKSCDGASAPEPSVASARRPTRRRSSLSMMLDGQAQVPKKQEVAKKQPSAPRVNRRGSLDMASPAVKDYNISNATPNSHKRAPRRGSLDHMMQSRVSRRPSLDMYVGGGQSKSQPTDDATEPTCLSDESASRVGRPMCDRIEMY